MDAFNRGDFAPLRALFTEDAVIHGVLGSGPLKLAEPIWRELRTGLLLRLIVEAMAAEGDTVAVR